jgi:predicted MFS family arabinose efflux permease
VAQHFGWTTSFGVAAALAVMGAICWLFVHPERELEPSNSGMADAIPLAQAGGSVMP